MGQKLLWAWSLWPPLHFYCPGTGRVPPLDNPGTDYKFLSTPISTSLHCPGKDLLLGTVPTFPGDVWEAAKVYR